MNAPAPQTNPRYTSTAIALHWWIALLILVAFVLGQLLDGPLTPTKLKLISWHKWAGVTVFVFLIARLVWRLTHRPPALPESMKAWQRMASHAVHWALYGLMFVVPITGWLTSSAMNIPTVWFGIVQLPDLIGPDKQLAHTLRETHEWLTNILVVLVLAHVGAALKHHVFDKDGVLLRMMPRRR